VFVLVVLFFALLIAYPWVVLTVGTILFLASLPLGYVSYRNYQRKDAAAAAAAVQAAAVTAAPPAGQPGAPTFAPGPTSTDHPPDPERPARLN
jgi:CDP-diacylglycerol---serine O-phosphatidyltransferase